MSSTWYGPLARAADLWHGWRDGSAGMPDPSRGVATTGYRETLIRRAQDAFEHERLWMESRRAAALVRLADARSRHEAAGAGLRLATERLDELQRAAPQVDMTELRYREERRPAVMIRLRRTREHGRRLAGARAELARARQAVDAVRQEIAVAEEEVDREILVALSRVRRIHEHTHRRLSAYRRRLVRTHPDGTWVNEIMDSIEPSIPGWAVRGVNDADLTRRGTTGPRVPLPSRERKPRAEPPRHRVLIRLDQQIILGADPDQVDHVVPRGIGIGARHATLRRHGDGYRVYDHGRGDGTFQAGQPLYRTDLRIGQAFTIGDYRYKLLPDNVLEETRLGPYSLVVSDLCAETNKGKPRLTRMSFAQRSGTVVAIVGPSGAGKSTLFSALLGELPTQNGAMFFGGMPLAEYGRQIRTLLGFVPQEDSLHPTLTVRQALGFAGRLRGPRQGTSARAARVEEVCRDLDLSGKVDSPIERLSGGQRKRVSIAMEILTKPRLLLLDEPTSGLDPGLDQEVMRALRTLADEEDRVVIVVTHSTDHLDLADEVLVVASEGRPVYFGPPQQLPDALATGSYADMMLTLRAPEDAAAAYQDGPASEDARTQAKDAREQVDSRPSGPGRPRGLGSLLRQQLPALIHRQIMLVLTRAPVRHPRGDDEGVWRRVKQIGAGFVVAMPLLVAVAGALLAAAVTRDPGLSGPAAPGTAPARTALSLLVTLTMLSAQALTYSDIVSEYAVVRRERRTGTAVTAIVLAKWMVNALLAVAQAAVITGVFVRVRSGPSASLVGWPWLDLFIGLAALGIAAMSAGLLISVTARKLEQAVAVATAVAIAQVALSGGLTDLSGGVRWLAIPLPSRWGFAATAASTDLRGISPAGTAADRWWTHSIGHWAFDLTMLGTLTVVFTTLAIGLLHWRLDRGDR